MEGRTRGASGCASTIIGAGIAGGLAATFWHVEELPFAQGELTGLLFLSAAIPPMIAVQLPLRRASTARPIAALTAAAAVIGFFGVTLALANSAAGRGAPLIFLGLAPLTAAAMAFASAAYLARIFRKARVRRTPQS